MSYFSDFIYLLAIVLLSVYLYLFCLKSYFIIVNLVLFEGSQCEYKTEFGLGEGRPRHWVELCSVINFLCCQTGANSITQFLNFFKPVTVLDKEKDEGVSPSIKIWHVWNSEVNRKLFNQVRSDRE